MKKSILFFAFLILLVSCKETNQERISKIVRQWEGKVIEYPSDLKFVSIIKGSVMQCDMPQSEYTILSYVDSIGCTSCELQLSKWQALMNLTDSLFKDKVAYHLIFNPHNKRELTLLLRQERFTRPVCFDENDSLNILNHFPSDMMLQTFLLDRNKKVVAIGNPVHNPHVKDLYFEVISGEKGKKEVGVPETTIRLSEKELDLGEFNWEEEQMKEFTIRNTGDNPLVINNVVTSCGCTRVEYAKEPIMPGKDAVVKVYYKATHEEFINKTITLYCNVSASPLKIRVTGNAK